MVAQPLRPIKQYRDTQKQSVTIAFDQALKGQQTFPGLIKLAKGSGAPANAATYLAGICYYYMGNYKEAINALEDFSPKSDESISPMALYALANCYACDNQLDKAVDTFKKAADKGIAMLIGQENHGIDGDVCRGTDQKGTGLRL